MKARTGLILGTVGGSIFWQISEGSVPTEANCSYLASPMTDYMAFAGGVYCAFQGLKLKSPGVAAFGAAVVTIHMFQFLHHKT